VRAKSGKTTVRSRQRLPLRESQHESQHEIIRENHCLCKPLRAAAPLGNLERYGLRIGILLWIMIAMMHFSTVGYTKPQVAADSSAQQAQAPLHIWKSTPLSHNHVVGALEDTTVMRPSDSMVLNSL
jgi:hypothetical protein